MSSSFLILAAFLFCIGGYGALTRRNAIVVLLSIEVMLQAVILNLVAFSHMGTTPSLTGHVFSLFVITVAAAEVALGVALVVSYVRKRGVSDVTEMKELKAP